MAERTRPIARLAAALQREAPPLFGLELGIGQWRVRIESNSSKLVSRLRHYFRHFPANGGPPDCVIVAIETAEPDFGLELVDWKRDPGKVGRKDTYADLGSGRVVRKVRTGMQFLMDDDVKMAVGPCLANDNQVVNFVNAQYIAWMLDRDWALCHAAAVTSGRGREGAGLAMAGFSGGGKSTLALHLMSRGLSFVSNDRLLVRRGARTVRMSGVPKFPRINPGTALNNPDLSVVVPPDRRAALADLPEDELWDLEEKYDVEIDEVFDGVRFEIEAALVAFVVLNWDRSSSDPMRSERVDLSARRDLLKAIMKSPGPFYRPAGRGWPTTMIELGEEPYLENMSGVPVYELSGGVDFDRAVELCLDVLSSQGRQRA